MTEDHQGAMDLSDLNCTDLMIRLVMVLKNVPGNSVVECIVRRDQRDTIEVPFTRTGYDVQVNPVDANRYLVRLRKNSAKQVR